MAAAVAQAGGFGMIGASLNTEETLEHAFVDAGNAPIGVGFITWLLEQQSGLFSVALAHKPKAVMLSFGDHAPYVDAIKAVGSLLICQIQTVAQAIEAAKTGADIIVAQGQEAGGHGMTARSTITLAPAVIDALGPDIPVVAAGGIADGRGLAAALALGCAGVSMGTRFAAAREAYWPESKKAALVAAKGDDTIRTEVFDILRRGSTWPDAFNGRAIRTSQTDRWDGDITGLFDALNEEKAKADAADARGDWAATAVWAGESVDLVHEILPAKIIVERTVREATAILSVPQSFSLVE